MNFELTADQQAVRQAARDLLNARCSPAAVRRQAENGGHDPALWQEVARLGWTGITIAEAQGGAGLGLVELTVVLEEFGRACAVAPLLSHSAAVLLLGAAEEATRNRLLPGLASGEQRAAVGMLGPDGTGTAIDAEGADVLLLGSVDAIRLATPAQAAMEPMELVDRTRTYSHIHEVGGDALHGDVAGALDRAEVALAAELVGVAQRGLEMAVSHAQRRMQFGRPIGVYQAVSHRCADMLIAVESARAATYAAAWAADAEPESLPRAASVAKVAAATAAWEASSGALQVLGGIGFTWEHDLQFVLKRAAAGARLFGPVASHRRRVAQLSGLQEVTR